MKVTRKRIPHPSRLLGRVWAFVQIVLLVFCSHAHAESEPAEHRLVVGVHNREPYAFPNDEGRWKGLGIEIWETVAAENHWNFTYLELPSEELVAALAARKVDLVIGELLVNSLDEKVMNFSQPFLESSIGIAVSARTWHPSWLHIVLHAFDWTLVRIFLFFVPVMLLFSILIWLLERHRRDGHFGGRPLTGLGSAFWFSAVTMTTTGYGDKVPVTFLGRLLSVAWMFLSLLLITAFTASVASTVATVRSSTLIRDIGDLRHYRNGVEPGSVAAAILDRHAVPVVSFPDYDTALRNLSEGAVDTVVGDTISLQYIISRDYPHSLSMLPLLIFSSRVAFGFPQDSPLMEPFNVAMLSFLHSPRWASVLESYLGSSDLAPVDARYPKSTTNP